MITFPPTIFFLLITIALFAMAVSGCSRKQVKIGSIEVPEGTEAYRGAVLFQKMACLSCHTLAGAGMTASRAPDLTNIADRLPTDNIVIRITNGSSTMPKYGDILKPDEIKAIVTFLTSVHVPSPTSPPSSYQDIRRLMQMCMPAEKRPQSLFAAANFLSQT